jgi:putative sporulation protein YtaF
MPGGDRLLFTYRVLAESALLALSLSTDIFVAFIAYGADGVRVSRGARLVSALVCTAIFAASGLLGAAAGPLVAPAAAKAVGFLALCAVGLSRVFDGAVKAAIRRFRAAKSTKACIKRACIEREGSGARHSGELSLRESAFLAVAMSVDGAAAGFGVGACGGGIALTTAMSMAFCLAAIALGVKLGGVLHGTKLARGRSMSAAGGLALLALAVWKLA